MRRDENRGGVAEIAPPGAGAGRHLLRLHGATQPRAAMRVGSTPFVVSIALVGLANGNVVVWLLERPPDQPAR